MGLFSCTTLSLCNCSALTEIFHTISPRSWHVSWVSPLHGLSRMDGWFPSYTPFIRWLVDTSILSWFQLRLFFQQKRSTFKGIITNPYHANQCTIIFGKSIKIYQQPLHEIWLPPKMGGISRHSDLARAHVFNPSPKKDGNPCQRSSAYSSQPSHPEAAWRRINNMYLPSQQSHFKEKTNIIQS